MEDERYRLIQGGLPIAWSQGNRALAEIQHYAMVYSQDGDVQIEIKKGRKWRAWPVSVTRLAKDTTP